MITICRADRSDLESIAAIQRAAPEAAQWVPEDYFAYEFQVARFDGTLAGFCVYRPVGTGEWEILNLAVAPSFRRRGVASTLLGSLPPGRIFIEVRESNAPARGLYEQFGFTIISVRKDYYDLPQEDGIVMEFQKC